MNKVFLIGRLVADPELRYTTSQTAVSTFTIAVNRNHSNKDGEEQTDFINCVAWRNLAVNIKEYLMKGSQIAIEGRIQVRSYDNQEGQKKYATEVIVNDVEFLNTRKRENGEETKKEGNVVSNPYEEMSNQVKAEFIDEEGFELPFN